MYLEDTRKNKKNLTQPLSILPALFHSSLFSQVFFTILTFSWKFAEVEECHRTRKNEKNECHSANNNRLPRRILLHICQFVSFYNGFCAILIFLKICEIGGVPHYFVWDRVTPIHTRKNKINKCHSTIVFPIELYSTFVNLSALITVSWKSAKLEECYTIFVEFLWDNLYLKRNMHLPISLSDFYFIAL